ncbi:major facilitator superfamily domain-containing protein [Corynascus novoguineensis]|uniref:Major facilitator superfamily domain-containing protein n=1 Tax=Corynascus novoguineensis TaxID=1126955 RepID=A0AAN7CYJ3_9PEZI|nr:major facilitator superfamily domain-containing protein [Corynascus novoguineensis]
MSNKTKKGPKLPAQQLAILAIARFAEPLALTSVFPYLPEMIASFGVEKNEVARWAGFTGAVFSIAQSCTAVAWGRASDKFGRKPVILIGLASTMACFLLWGMSTSLPMAITIRAVMGGGNGNVGIIRTMVAEMVPEKELQPKAFSLMPLVWSIGSVFGPAFGGFFARPAEQYPDLFGNIDYFKRYPFALPNLMACCVFFVSFMTGLLFLKETLQSKRHKRDWGLVLGEKLTRPFQRPKAHARRRRLSFVDDEASAPLLADSSMSSSEQLAAHDEPITNREIFTYQTSINLLSYTFLALHSVAYDQVLPVFLNYPRVAPDETNSHLPFKFTGGFGLSSDKIGTIYTVYGIACGIVQFFLFPTLCARFGVLNCFRTATLIFPLIYLLTPYTALIQDTTARYAVFLTMMLVKGFVVIIGFPCTTILLTNSASSLRVLGTLNGFATTFSGLGRAIGPAAAGAVFSWGIRKGYAIAPWWLLATIALAGAVVPWFIEEGPGPGCAASSRNISREEEEGEEGDGDGEHAALLGGSSSSSSSSCFSSSDSDSDSDGGAGSKKQKKGSRYGTL